MPSDVYTVKQLAEKLQIGRKQAYELIHDGTIQYIKIKSSIRIPKQAYEQFLNGTTNGESRQTDKKDDRQLNKLEYHIQ